MQTKEPAVIQSPAKVAVGRRQLLDAAGRVALVTPPAITLLLTSGGAQPAWASGIGGQPRGNFGNNGFGNGGGDGVPGRSGKSDKNR